MGITIMFWESIPYYCIAVLGTVWDLYKSPELLEFSVGPRILRFRQCKGFS